MAFEGLRKGDKPRFGSFNSPRKAEEGKDVKCEQFLAVVDPEHYELLKEIFSIRPWWIVKPIPQDPKAFNTLLDNCDLLWHKKTSEIVKTMPNFKQKFCPKRTMMYNHLEENIQLTKKQNLYLNLVSFCERGNKGDSIEINLINFLKSKPLTINCEDYSSWILKSLLISGFCDKESIQETFNLVKSYPECKNRLSPKLENARGIVVTF